MKRFCDVVFSAIALLLLLPVFALIAIGIKLSDRGPVFFRATRVGLHGKCFTMYKFRTMRANHEKGHLITLRNDSRIFPFGSFLRKTKLDEIPQLVNILRGEMSIVGWRPEDEENAPIVFAGKFSEILDAKPGLTSPGSIYDYTHGERYESEEAYAAAFIPQKMELELYYVNHQGFFYDVSIVARTFCVILAILFGKDNFQPPKELSKLQQVV